MWLPVKFADITDDRDTDYSFFTVYRFTFNVDSALKGRRYFNGCIEKGVSKRRSYWILSSNLAATAR